MDCDDVIAFSLEFVPEIMKKKNQIVEVHGELMQVKHRGFPSKDASYREWCLRCLKRLRQENDKLAKEDPPFKPCTNFVDRFHRDAAWRENMIAKNKVDVADLEKRCQDALEFQREGPRKARTLPRWMIEEHFSTLRSVDRPGAAENKPRGFTPMGVAAIESFKGRSKGEGKGKSNVSEDTRSEIVRQDWWDADSDRGWNDRRDNWREGQWRQDREWHGDARERERSGHRRWDDNSWEV